jgi:hypothetical protein
MVLDTALNACESRLEFANEKLKRCDTLANRTFRERDNETRQKEFHKKDAKIERKDRIEAERKLKRTRQIGIGATIVGFILGVVAVLVI